MGFEFGRAAALSKPTAAAVGAGGGFDFKFGARAAPAPAATAAARPSLFGVSPVNQSDDADETPLGRGVAAATTAAGSGGGATPMSTSDGAATAPAATPPQPRAAAAAAHYYPPPTPASVLATDCTAATPLGGATPLSGHQRTPLPAEATPAPAIKFGVRPGAGGAANHAAAAATGTTAAGATTASANKGPATWADVFLWRDPVSTAVIFALGCGAYAAASWALSGGAPVAPTSAVAYALLAHLGLNFVRFLLSARWHAASMWEGSAWADGLAERAARSVRRAAALHDALLSNRDPHATLAVALGLWALAWLGATFTARELLVGGWLAAFTLPALYDRRRAAVNARLARARRATLGRLDAAEMPRTARLLALTAALTALFFLSTWAQFGIGFLVAAAYWRTTLAPADVEAIRSAAGPLTHEVTRSVRKVRARLSSALDDARALCGSTAGPASRTASRFAGGAGAALNKRHGQ